MATMALAAMLAVGLVAAGCDQSRPQLPEPPPQRSGTVDDPGFPIKRRPACSPTVRAAMSTRTAAEIARAFSQGANFTCGSIDHPLPLDVAVMEGSFALVKALLDARADPNARWTFRGDRFPLQEAIEAGTFGNPTAHRPAIVRLLLRHGADANARWCPYESRSADPALQGCVSEGGVTPLMMAAALDELDVVYVLLHAGADPDLLDGSGARALDYARGASLHALVSSLVARARERDIDILSHVSGRPLSGAFPGPWDETPLGRALVGNHHGVPPPPPQLPGAVRPLPPSARYTNPRSVQVRVLLALGADPDQRLTWGTVDWTPLALAITSNDVESVQALLSHGADPNARWCVPVTLDRRTHVTKAALGCTTATGMTPIMMAASLGAVNLVRLLVRYGADASLRTWDDKTALSYATESGSLQVVEAVSERDGQRYSAGGAAPARSR